jgi:endonuclease/exonuclease/phosphatase (EEP) superfamily protein YafD
VVLVLTLAALEWWGERNWLLGVLLYAPPQMLLLPLLALTPASLLFRWRLVGWHLAAVALLLFGFMTFRWSRIPPVGAAAITAVTFNAGESNRPQFLEFLGREKPDLVLLQDVGGRSAVMAAQLPGTFSASLGQFCFISKFPLGKPAFVEAVKANGQPVAARCEAVINGRPTALYSVHLPTPRRELSRFLGGRRILGDLVGRPHREPGFGNYRDWLAARIELARALARVFAEEPLPLIIGGDFNTPDHGYIYRLFAGQMTDAFTHAGRGWGLTFPGSTHNPLSFYGPWLRLDYFFVGHGWKAVECRPEPGRKSQHKAVLARFEPQPMP